jgi:hypothetical protein
MKDTIPKFGAYDPNTFTSTKYAESVHDSITTDELKILRAEALEHYEKNSVAQHAFILEAIQNYDPREAICPDSGVGASK